VEEAPVTSAVEFIGRYWLAVASHLWQTAIVLAALALLARMMRAAPARVTNALWWIGLAKLLVPFAAIRFLFRGFLERFAADPRVGTIDATAVTVWIEKASPYLDPAGAALRSSPAELLEASTVPATLTALWLAGAVWFSISWLKARRAGASPEMHSSAEWSSVVRRRLTEALRGTGVAPSAIRVAPGSGMPGVFGLVRPRILLSEAVVHKLPADELRGVILHEDAHRRRMEPLRFALQRAAIIAFFYFPPLWFLLRRLRDTTELACDEAAVDRGIEPSVYARALARAFSIGLAPARTATALAFGGPSLIRRRLDRLGKEGRSVVMLRHRVVLGLAVACLVVASALPLTSPATADEEPERTEEAEATEVPESEPAAEEVKTYTLTLESSADPEYPEDAKRDGVGGKVTLKLVLSPDGTTKNIFVLEDIEGYPSLAEAAEAAAWKWTFQLEGSPEEDVEVIVPVQFRMHGEKTMEMSITIPDAQPEGSMPEAADEPETPVPPEEPAVPSESGTPVPPEQSAEPDERAPESPPEPEEPPSSNAPPDQP
jgi:TonB family protein